MFGPVTAIRSAVSPSRTPIPRARRTRISFSLSSPVFASMCSPARPIQSPSRLMNSWLMSPLTPPIR